MTADDCGEARTALGVYVLGALEPAERARVEAHLAKCAACREELASFAALPGLLGRVSLDDVEAVPAVGGDLLERLLAAVAHERRRSRRTRWIVGAAAGVVVAAAVGTAVAATRGTSTGSSVTQAASEVFRATNPTTHLSATVVAWPEDWGTSVEVKVDGVVAGGYGDRCRLVAVSADGGTDVAASWSPTPTGKVDAFGATAFQNADVVSYRIVGPNGSTLVSVPAS